MMTLQTPVQVNQIESALLSIKKEKAITDRWEELLPWCLMDARKTSNPTSTMEMLRSRHHDRCLELIYNRIPWASVRRNALDDPHIPERFFKEVILLSAIERRRARMGRIKGKVKGPSQCQHRTK